jgi:hypothetical protein
MSERLDQLTYNFERGCDDVLLHLAHWDCIDLLATRSTTVNVKHTVVSQGLSLFTGRLERVHELDPITDKDLTVMAKPEFSKLLPLANRLEGILARVDATGDPIDEDMTDAEINFWSSQLRLFQLPEGDVLFFQEHERLLVKVNIIVSRTKLTLQALRTKLGTLKMTGKKLKLLQFVEIERPYLEQNKERDRMYGQSRQYVQPNYALTEGGVGSDMSALEKSIGAFSPFSPPHVSTRHSSPIRDSKVSQLFLTQPGDGGRPVKTVEAATAMANHKKDEAEAAKQDGASAAAAGTAQG